MREPPPLQLTKLLQRLGLATAKDLQSVEPVVHRMAGELPRFQSVWIDALRQSRLLTHFQAAEIMADRGEQLRAGRYVLCHVVQECGYVTVYKAEDSESHKACRMAMTPPEGPREVRSISNDSSSALGLRFGLPDAADAGSRTADRSASPESGDLPDRLRKLCTLANRLPQVAGLIASVGQDGSRLWVASPWIEGTSAADWMLHHGRFPPEIVAAIAREMLQELAAMEEAGIVHGDIRIENVLLLPDGRICLPHAGLRGILRPHEGISRGDLAPAACGAIAPERVSAGAPPNAASDLFSCGCVWWQMLCGRPPLGGGDALSRMRLAQTASIDDFRNWAVHVPPSLADAVTACLRKDPHDRPRSIAALCEKMGPSTRGGRQAIVRCLAAAARPHAPWLQAKRAKAKKGHPQAWTAVALLLMAAVAVAWPLWVASNRARAVGWTSRSVEPATDRSGGLSYSPSVRAAQPSTTPTPKASPSAVVRASFDEAAKAPPSRGEPKPASDSDFHLPGERPIPAESLHLQPGQIVHARTGRASIAVSPHGWTVQADRVTFENIDFIRDETIPSEDGRNASEPALIRLACSECTFVGCSFQSPAGEPELSTAIRWERGADNAVSLPSGRLRLKDCVFRRVAAAVDSRSRGAIAVEAVNLLHVGPGPFLTLPHLPGADEPLRIALSQVTLRDASCLMECGGTADPGEVAVGEIGIDAAGCVFAPRDGGTLLLLKCRRSPRPLLRGLKWTGQGSVVSPATAFALWQRDTDSFEALDDTAISVSGLVRGRIDFAGRCDGNPANSRVLQCQAPLVDSDSAGASAASLPAVVR